ncbi:NAD(P)/FAD-dependent oxidoreductase [Rathayibacter toxicus]|uniref:Pyridine nucleotide-disulfide oxidoreductase n=1 Tax=Rathayibacter toxicus TaxID=145458 RepID=A0A2S5Y4K5_9MICO|nr:FAD-dependent oxidoreductase [Rathayibacter toxicus]PPH21195.1 pyridine nucleotide-disulfide oxidoreductase [Rathayibacter toxicus]PPH56309.1 pyridine nucleotide-disulfide oxidoreductase [Rathayibacter toxicus]PPH58406.1 pyridine nucleotide-disulfide oxidoreductase [Rathayibacter toxicus]PPH86151.1 pyridine nucleotide-disulfide oxidoreductase [Rathayibacter toxicus]PPI13482.1 pyridine nucleotide-disulfide oxidoreductase [Rathayibacter toxicus]
MTVFGATRILIVGGGYVGLYAAWGLEKRRSETPIDVTLVEPSPYMTYQPLLPEVAGGHVQPRHVTVPLVSALRRTRVLRGAITAISLAERKATVAAVDGSDRTLVFDQIVFALGAVTRTFPTPGLAEHGIGFKTVEEASHLRDRVIENSAKAALSSDQAERRRLLTFVVVGGGYTGVEALSELLDLSRRVLAAHPSLTTDDVTWHLVEALDRVAPEVGPELSRWTLDHLRARGVRVHLKTTMPSCVGGVVELSSGERIPAGTIVWTAGVTPNPILDATDAPRGPKGHVVVDARLRVMAKSGEPVGGAWAAGDVAQVPDLTSQTQPAYYPPNAQNAVRQAKLVARNIIADLTGGVLEEYRHVSVGTVAEYGVGKGAGVVKGVRLRGFPAWLAHRAYHGLTVPSRDRKWRIITGWFVDGVAPRDMSPMNALQDPRRAFREIAEATDRAAAEKATPAETADRAPESS